MRLRHCGVAFWLGLVALPGWDDEARLLGELDRLAREAPHDPAPLVAGHIH